MWHLGGEPRFQNNEAILGRVLFDLDEKGHGYELGFEAVKRVIFFENVIAGLLQLKEVEEAEQEERVR